MTFSAFFHSYKFIEVDKKDTFSSKLTKFAWDLLILRSLSSKQMLISLSYFNAWTSQKFRKFSLQVGHGTKSNNSSQLFFNLVTPNAARLARSTPLSEWPGYKLLFQTRLGYYSNMVPCSGRLITNSVYTWVSEWVTHSHIKVPARNSFLHFAYPRV